MSLPYFGNAPFLSRKIKHLSRGVSAFKLAALAAAGVALAVDPLFAATNTWVGNTSNLWNVGSNWSAGLPTNGDSIVFGAPGSAGVALSDDITSLTVGAANADGITFSLSAAGYTITRPGAQTLTAGSSGTGVLIKDLSLFAQSLNVPIALTGDQTIQVGGTSGAFISGLTLQGAITGASRLTKTGTGLLTLSSNSNTFSGLTISSGIVSIGSDANLGVATGSVIINGGALRTNIGSVTLNANRSIVLGDATPGSGGTIQVTQTTAGTAGTSFNGVISNGGTANSLTKTGAGTLTLGGTNTYTGATKINQGQLTLAFNTGGAPAADIINSASTLVLGGVPNLLNNTGAGGPVLFVQGNSSDSVATSQTFNGLSLVGGGVSNIVVRAGVGTTDTTLALGAITHVPGGTVGFSTLTNGSTGTGVITTTTANTNGILGGWATTAATGTGTAALTQTDWAANDGTGKIVAYTGYTSVTGATPAIASSSSANLRIEGATAVNATLAAAGTTDINTIQSTNTVGHSITVGANNTLRLGTYGGIWKTSATNTTLSISGGTLTAGGPNDNTAGEIVFNANGAAGFNSTIAVNSVIANNGTGAVSVVKQGLSTLTLTGANTYSGGTFINQGNIAANNALALGTGSVTVASGATLTLSTTKILTYANDLYLSGYAINLYGNTITGKVTLLGDTVIQSNSTDGGTTMGRITGDYNVAFTNGMHTLTNTGNDNTGNTGINALTSAALNTLIGSNTGIKLGANEVIANGAGKGNLIIAASSSATGTLDMNGKNETINGLVSAGGLVTNTFVTNTSAGTASTLTLGDNDQTATFGGSILDGAGTVEITKIGAGTQTFSGANTYTGKTTVAAGTLLLSSSTVDSTIAGSTVIEVQSGATLNVAGITTANGFVVGSTQTLVGNGTVIGNTTVQGNLNPGASPGLLTFSNNLTLTGTAVTTMEIIGTSRGVAGGYDAINLGTTSALTYDGMLTLTMSGLIAGGTYDLFNFTLAAQGAFDAVSFGGGFYTGAWTSAGSGVWTASSNGQDFSFSEATGDLNVTAAIPEPSTWALLGLGLLTVVVLRRRCVA